MKIKVIFLLFFSILLLIPFLAKGAVVINEIAWMGTEIDSSNEWIELYNNTETEINLNGWGLYEEGGKTLIEPLTGIIGAKSYYLIERTDNNTVPNIEASQFPTGWGGYGLNNNGEYLQLLDNNSTIIDEVNCSGGWFEGNKDTKQTMERTVGGWQTSLNPGGTPKAQNSSGEEPKEEPQEPEEPEEEPEGEPEQPADPPDGETDEPETPPTPPSSNQPPIADAGNNIIAFVDDEITFDGSKSYDPDGDELIFTWNLGGGISEKGITVTHKYEYSYPKTHLVTLMVSDGQFSDEDTITVEIYPKKITINEFLPSPAGKDAEEEWIELYNDSDQIINIGGWQLDDEDGGSKPFIFPENTLIPPKSYLVLSRQITGIALNNDGDKARLLLPTGAAFQEVSYEKAPKGQSSARTPEGFIWSTPTPGLPNVINAEEEKFSYSGTVNQTYMAKPESSEKNKQNSLDYYNLANLEKSTGSSSKLILIILTMTTVVFAIAIGIFKLKKKI